MADLDLSPFYARDGRRNAPYDPRMMSLEGFARMSVDLSSEIAIWCGSRRCRRA